MDGEGTSWIRRANFSHTVCYRLIPPSILESIPFTELNSGVKTRPPNSSSALKSQATQLLTNLETNGYVVDSEIQRNPVTKKQRSVSPAPQISVPEVFEEAKVESKRFSTPHPRRMNSDMEMMPKLSRKDSFGKILRSLSHSGPIRDQGTLKVQERVKSKKGKGSFKYLDYGGGSKVSSVDFVDEYCIDGSKVSYGEKFAQGLYSRLYHGKYCGEDVALKVIAAHTDEENLRLEPRLKRQFTKEATHLSRLNHPNVIKFLGVHKGNCIVTEYLPEGSLRSYLHKLEGKRLPLPKVLDFAIDIAKGMQYIHSKEIVHRDLKPENVLIDKDFHLKIADFGIASEAEYCDMLGDDTGTFRWMAPEMIRRRPHGRKADVYSFALVLWELVAGAIPYEEMTPIQAAFAVVHKNIRPIIPKDCPAAMKELIELCWTLHQDRRPDFSQIVKVLEQFKTSLETDGSLTLLPTQICPDLKKGPKYWIHKFGSVHHHGSSSGSSLGSTMPKPRFA